MYQSIETDPDTVRHTYANDSECSDRRYRREIGVAPAAAAAPGPTRDADKQYQESVILSGIFTLVNTPSKRYCILLLWLIGVGISCYCGPEFLKHTVSSFSAPKGTAAYRASEAYHQYFPIKAGTVQLFILVEALSSSVSSGASESESDTVTVTSIYSSYVRDVTLSLNETASTYALTIPVAGSYVEGYYVYANTPLHSVGQAFVAPNNQSTIVAVSYETLNATNHEIVSLFQSAIERLSDSSIYKEANKYRLSLTGIDALFVDVEKGTERDMVRIDAIVLPLAMAVLAFYVRSVRLMFIPLATVGASILTSLGIMYPVALQVDVAAFTPSIMLSLVVAINTDYNLFLLTRFGEELRKGNDPFGAVRMTVLRAGRVISVSGLTLIITMIALVFFPLDFLRTEGVGASMALVMTLLSNLTLSPSLLLTFPKFFSNLQHPIPMPDWLRARCCSVCAGNTAKSQQSGDTDDSHSQDAESGDVQSDLHKPLHHSTYGALVDSGETEAQRAELDAVIFGNNPEELFTPQQMAQMRAGYAAQVKSIWHKLAMLVTKPRNAFAVIVIVLALSLPICVQTVYMKTTIDSTQLFPRDAASLKAYDRLGQDFAPGLLYPFDIIVESNATQEVLTPLHFEIVTSIIASLTEADLAEPTNITSVAYVRGQPVPIGFAQLYLSPQFDCNHDSLCPSYRFLFDRQVSHNRRSSIITITSNFNPLDEHSSVWIQSVRTLLATTSSQYAPYASLYLNGGSVAVFDAVAEVNRDFPIIVGATVGIVFLIVALVFRSILIPLRLVFTTALSLTFVYGIAVIALQYGMFDEITSITRLYWLVPIMSFALIVGLSLDYDIFLLTRIIETRQVGFTTRASVVKGVYWTGHIITGAGLIMCVSFGGLLLAQEDILVEFGFLLCVAVLYDTFIVRSLLVPAVLVVFFGEWNWWPGKMPDGYKSALNQSDMLVEHET
jgi:putative drug exporter of the RND superfamily